MSNLEPRPPKVGCGAHTATVSRDEAAVEIITAREVPLGGPRAMRVQRTLPARGRTMIGAWCFVDHYGPDAVADTGGMVVPPHPHTGLQTVSWLFEGTVEHRDALGTIGDVVPGEVNLMTAGRGISHSEVSTPDTDLLHGVQLWTALPDADRHTDRAFTNHRPIPLQLDGAVALVFIGALEFDDAASQPEVSPVEMFTPIVGAEITLEPGAEVTIIAADGYEYGVLTDTGQIQVAGHQVERSALAYLAPGVQRIRISAGAEGGRVIVIGGTPFGEQILMWWNFVGRSHEEIVEFRKQWQTEIGGADPEQFGTFPYPGEALPAPELPQVRLRPRT